MVGMIIVLINQFVINNSFGETLQKFRRDIKDRPSILFFLRFRRVIFKNFTFHIVCLSCNIRSNVKIKNKNT